MPLEKLLITHLPLAREESITALCEIDLSAGMVIFPIKGFDLFTDFNNLYSSQCTHCNKYLHTRQF